MGTHPTFARAALGGLVGTLAMTAMMYLVAPMMGLHMDIAAMLGAILGGSWAAGMVLHLVNGTLIFPAVYAYALAGSLPGSPAVKGTFWGIALWLIAQVVVMSSAQVGKTEIVNNVVGYYISQDPAPLLIVQPTLEMGEAWSKDRLAPMVRDTAKSHSADA